MNGLQKAIERHEEWWLGKYIRPAWYENNEPFKRVVKIETYGNPSYVYGNAELYFEDGSKAYACATGDAYRPRKKDWEVLEAAEQCLHTDPPSALPSVVESQNTAGG